MSAEREAAAALAMIAVSALRHGLGRVAMFDTLAPLLPEMAARHADLVRLAYLDGIQAAAFEDADGFLDGLTRGERADLSAEGLTRKAAAALTGVEEAIADLRREAATTWAGLRRLAEATGLDLDAVVDALGAHDVRSLEQVDVPPEDAADACDHLTALQPLLVPAPNQLGEPVR